MIKIYYIKHRTYIILLLFIKHFFIQLAVNLILYSFKFRCCVQNLSNERIQRINWQVNILSIYSRVRNFIIYSEEITYDRFCNTGFENVLVSAPSIYLVLILMYLGYYGTVCTGYGFLQGFERFKNEKLKTAIKYLGLSLPFVYLFTLQYFNAPFYPLLVEFSTCKVSDTKIQD